MRLVSSAVLVSSVLACGGAASTPRPPAPPAPPAPPTPPRVACVVELAGWASPEQVDLYGPDDVEGRAAPIATLHRREGQTIEQAQLQIRAFAAAAARPLMPLHLRHEGVTLDAAAPLELLTTRGVQTLRPGLMVGPHARIDVVSATDGAVRVAVQVPGAPAGTPGNGVELLDVPCAALSAQATGPRLARVLFALDDAMMPMLALPTVGVVELFDAPGGARTGALLLDDQTVVLERAPVGRWTRVARFSDDASIASVGWTDAPGLTTGSTLFWDSAGRFGGGAHVSATLEVTVLRCPREVPLRLVVGDEVRVIGRAAPGTPLRLARRWQDDRATTAIELAWLRPARGAEFVLAPGERAGCVATAEQVQLGD